MINQKIRILQPSPRLRIQCHRNGKIAGHDHQKDQLEARPRPGPEGLAAQTVQRTAFEGHDSRAQQWLRRSAIQS